ncbi:MAG: preprotein translocase subunit SecA [Cellvibrionaceae bacterium]
MVGKLFRSILGTKNDRELRRMRKTVARINEFEEAMQGLDDEALKNKTAEFRQRFADGETLDQLLPEAFAAVREASRRSVGLRHFDVQLIGGIVLHEGKISEMKTGEGKTLVATLAAYLNAIPGEGVHLITVNDYLASRDAAWMGPIYRFLGMTVGVIQSMQATDLKRQAYSADITYGTNNEYGFDYLRDNMALRLQDKVQRSLPYAIVDEVDSILIDEARTPLIISGAAQDSSAMYKRINTLIPKLKRHVEGQEGEATQVGHYTIDEKARQVELTESGHQLVEELLIKEGLLPEEDSLYSPANLGLVHHVNSALRAHTLFHKDVDYIIQNNQVVLIDEHTGRTMPGRRLSEGLHQAIEAKEGVAIQSESQTLASTTFQNYFRLYDKLSGMTGTADTEAFEFRQIYGLDVVVIPTNQPIAREDLNDLVYMSMEEKYAAIIDDIKSCQDKNAPVLVGVGSIETSEEVSRRLKKAGIEHQVLNAKFHEKEAEIIAQAGRPGTVTIATNMAGRGTDIVLGGNWEAEIAKLDSPTQEQIDALKADWKARHDTVIEAGGLHIICTERNESRRIDNQFRGRAGRQGDPGVSRFYLSMEDNLMRIFASDSMRGFMQRIGMEKGEAIESRMLTNTIENAQRKVEGRNFDTRKQLLEYDDVANDQRQVVYQQRQDLLESESIEEATTAIRGEVIDATISGFVPPQSIEEQWDIPGLEQHLAAEYGLSLPLQKWLDEDENLHEESLRERIIEAAQNAYDEKCARFGEVIRDIEKQVMLQVLDRHWKEHLANMDHLRQGIGLRAYAQKNPKQEYKREAFELFQTMLNNIQHETIRILARVEPMSQEQMEEMERRQREALEKQKMQLQHAEASGMGPPGESGGAEPASKQAQQAPYVREGQKVGRNEPCPCGSGKKYKQCHGRLA